MSVPVTYDKYINEITKITRLRNSLAVINMEKTMAFG